MIRKNFGGKRHKETLEGLGFTIVGLAASPEEALKLATGTMKPDVVVTTLDMPEPSATYEMMAAISRVTKERVDFVVIDLTDQVRSTPKPLFNPDELGNMMFRRYR